MIVSTCSGCTVAYTESGAGDPGLLMLHGWAASSAQLTPLLPHLKGHALAVDFRGHGASPAPATDFGDAELVDDALAVIEAAGVDKVVPVAVAHAGWVAYELCRRIPERIAHVVLLGWIVLDPPPPFLDALAALQDESTWQRARDGLFGMWTQGVDHPGVLSFVSDVMGAHGYPMWARGGREIAAEYARHGRPLDAFAALPSPPRVLHLYAQPAAPEYLAAQQAFAAEHDWFSVQRIDSASSHFTSIEAPALVAGAIERFVQG
jgi:pimeloyl-ACP methyl ester carboxylesterase